MTRQRGRLAPGPNSFRIARGSVVFRLPARGRPRRLAPIAAPAGCSSTLDSDRLGDDRAYLSPALLLLDAADTDDGIAAAHFFRALAGTL